jgi:glycosyltransferase involved in cell wall biosynthesis
MPSDYGIAMIASAPATPLHITGVDPELNFAGGERQVLGLSEELRRSGHQVSLLCDPRGELWQRAQGAGISCYPLSIRNSVDLPAGLRLRDYLRRHRCDVIHFHTARAHALAPFALGMEVARVVTRRMDYVPNRWLAPWLYNRAVDGVAAISQEVALSLAQAGVRPDRITIVHSGVDCDRFLPPTAAQRASARAALQLNPDEIVIGALGSLEARKGHACLLEAVALLARQGLALKCLVAGHGTLAAGLTAQASAVNLKENFRLVGSFADPLKLLWAIDIFVQPSLKEGLGVALLEAMACGLPVIASRVGGMPEAVEDNRYGRLAPPADAVSLAAAIRELGGARELRQRLGAAARQRVLDRFSMAAMAKGTIDLYLTCLKEGSRPCAA